MHIATERNQVKVIELLVSHDSTDVNAKNNALATALHIAAIHGLPECANVLLAHPNIEINPLNDIGQTPLYNTRLMCRLRDSGVRVSTEDMSGMNGIHRIATSFAAKSGV